MRNVIKLFAASYIVASIFILWGYSIGKFGVFPAKVIDPMVEEVQGFFRGGDAEPEKTALDRIMLHRQEFRSDAFKAEDNITWEPARKIEISGPAKSGRFYIYDETFRDNGYLLISRYSFEHKQVIVELLLLSNLTIMHQWIPPISKILELDGLPESEKETNSISGYRMQHPFLLDDGSIVFHSGDGALVRLDKKSDIVWIIPRILFHHSIEMGADGNLYVPVVVPKDNAYHYIDDVFREEGYAIVSPDGALVKIVTIFRILVENGYRGIVLGRPTLGTDPFHLNDVQPIVKDAGLLRTGDIAMSMRHNSTVLVYRPIEDKILALSVGPWLAQHDVSPLPNGNLSVFNNEYIMDQRFNSLKRPFSSIVIWDPLSNFFTEPYNHVLKNFKVYTASQGRARILPNGDAYIEESNSGRLLRVSSKQPRWTYINFNEDETITGAIHWCRYLLSDEITQFWK